MVINNLPQLSTNKGLSAGVSEEKANELGVKNVFLEMLEVGSEAFEKKPIDEKQAEKTEGIEDFRIFIESPKSSVIDASENTLLIEKSPEQMKMESLELEVFELIKEIATGYLDNQLTKSKDSSLGLSEKVDVALNKVVNAVEPLLFTMEKTSLEKISSVGGQEREIVLLASVLKQGVKELKEITSVVPANVDVKTNLSNDALNQSGEKIGAGEYDEFNSTQTGNVIEKMKEISNKIDLLLKNENVSITPKDFRELIHTVEGTMSATVLPAELNDKTSKTPSILVAEHQLFQSDENGKAKTNSLLTNDGTKVEMGNKALVQSNPLKKENDEGTRERDGSVVVDAEIDSSIIAKETSDVWKVTGKGEKIQEMSLPELKQNISGKIEQLQQVMIGKNRMLVQINPKNLGVVDLYFKKEGDKVQLTVEFEKPETKQKIEALIDDIRKEFKDKNLEVNYVFKERDRSEKEESKQRKNEKQQSSRNHEEESFESMIKETIGGISNA